jgi:type I restriction enzyme S subunit
MSSIEWKLERLGKLALINAKSISGKYAYKEIEYIDTSSVIGNEFGLLQKIKLSEAPSRAKRIVQHGDTIISTVRPIQRHFGFIRNPKPNTIASTGFAVITPRSINPEFLYYYLSQDSITNYLNGIAETSTTTFPAFRPEVLSDLEILIPEDENIQRRIAEILSALDDKIELNRQTNATLEAIAQAIFKEWFVDFNFPGATGEMVESELGMIPEGWRIGNLGDFGEIVCGKTPSKTNENFFGGNIPFIKIPDMHNSVFIVETSDTLTHEGALSQKNKFLPPNSIIVSCIATIGLVSLTAEKSQTNQQINAIIPSRDILTHYVYFTAKNIKDQLFELGSGGSATLNVNTSSFSNIKCVIPSEYVLSSFDFLVKPLFEGILANQQEILTIAKCRDEILPKLMSGEIDL